MEDSLFHYRARIVDVYDGDTVTAEVDLGFRIQITEKFRLLGINTPEVRGEEREQGLVSRDALRDKILGKDLFIETKRDKKGKYGRYLATLHLPEGDVLVNVNDWIVSEGLGVYHEY